MESFSLQVCIAVAKCCKLYPATLSTVWYATQQQPHVGMEWPPNNNGHIAVICSYPKFSVLTRKHWVNHVSLVSLNRPYMIYGSARCQTLIKCKSTRSTVLIFRHVLNLNSVADLRSTAFLALPFSKTVSDTTYSVTCNPNHLLSCHGNWLYIYIAI